MQTVEIDEKMVSPSENPLHAASGTLTVSEFESFDEISRPSQDKKRRDSTSSITDDLGGGMTLAEKMWTWNYIGLYAQYAAVGLLYGMSGMSLNFCVYHYDGDANLCANANGFIFLAWSFKLFYAIGTDSFRPFGMRRVPYMIAGWSGALMMLFIIACSAEALDASSWVGLMMVVQAFVMLSDVPADGYCVELGHREDEKERGQILATAQRIRFSFSVLAGVIQCFLTNGPSTNADGCNIDFENCWKWGFTIGALFYSLHVMYFPIRLTLALTNIFPLAHRI